MDQSSVTVKGPDGDRRIPARTKIWAAGVQASPLAAMLAEATGAGTDRAGRVAVRPDCSLPGHPEVFAIGDMVRLGAGIDLHQEPAAPDHHRRARALRAHSRHR